MPEMLENLSFAAQTNVMLFLQLWTPSVVSALINACIFGNVTVIVNRLYATQARYHSHIARVKEFIRFHRFPSSLRRDTMESFHHLWSYSHGIDMPQVRLTAAAQILPHFLSFSLQFQMLLSRSWK